MCRGGFGATAADARFSRDLGAETVHCRKTRSSSRLVHTHTNTDWGSQVSNHQPSDQWMLNLLSHSRPYNNLNVEQLRASDTLWMGVDVGDGFVLVSQCSFQHRGRLRGATLPRQLLILHL